MYIRLKNGKTVWASVDIDDEIKNIEYQEKSGQIKTKMVFLYVGDETYLCLDVGEKDSEGRCPVVYVKSTKCVVLARSLEEFAKKMDESMSYYVDIW